MDDNDLPEGWSMPDDMAESLNKFMNQKARSTPLNDLMEAVNDMANEIADVEPEPGDWAGWIAYLLEALQEQVEKDRKGGNFETMLQALRDDLEIRITGGKW